MIRTLVSDIKDDEGVVVFLSDSFGKDFLRHVLA